MTAARHPSWREIARALAQRLAWADTTYCANEADIGSGGTSVGHHVDAPDPDCPFCADRTAYLAYKAKAQATGSRFRDTADGTRVVNVDDLRRGTDDGR